jgi:hypothetical protein
MVNVAAASIIFNTLRCCTAVRCSGVRSYLAQYAIGVIVAQECRAIFGVVEREAHFVQSQPLACPFTIENHGAGYVLLHGGFPLMRDLNTQLLLSGFCLIADMRVLHL